VIREKSNKTNKFRRDPNYFLPLWTTLSGFESRSRQRIGILDLPLPDPPPDGAEWIEAYRRWACGSRSR
jgi:hypothetical protein